MPRLLTSAQKSKKWRTLERNFGKEKSIDFLILDLESDTFFENDKFLNDVDALLTEIENRSASKNFNCQQCVKKCKSEKGLKCHITIQHSKNDPSTQKINATTDVKRACSTDELITFIKESIKFIENDLFYPPYIRDELSKYMFSEDDAKHSFDLIKEVIENFNGGA